MKKTFFISKLLLLAFCLISFNSFSQEKLTAKEDPIKDQFVETYAWTKSHFESKSNAVVSMKEMETAEGHKFVLVESKDSKVLYDTNGEQYCTDYEDFNCVEFYKLSKGDLSWKKSQE